MHHHDPRNRLPAALRPEHLADLLAGVAALGEGEDAGEAGLSASLAFFVGWLDLHSLDPVVV